MKRVISTAALLALSLQVMALLGDARPARAAEPKAGAIGPTQATVHWSGPVVATSQMAVTCDTDGVTCDEFALNVDVPEAHWSTNVGGAKVTISWTDASDLFEMYVFDASGSQVASAPIGIGEGPKTSATAVVPNASGTYTVQVIYWTVTDSGYTGSAAFVSEQGAVVEKGKGAFFDTSVPVRFAPATLVSPTFLGAEPQITMEKPTEGSPEADLDPDRIFIDWPLSTFAQIGQLARSQDGGESFRMLFDPSCAQRTRPTCQTGGGGDSETEVSPYTGTLYFSDQQALLAQEALASSTDHGDTFPASRQFTVSNTTTATDRQWIAATDPSVVSVGGRRIGAFFSYLSGVFNTYVQAIDEDGVPVAQPAPQIAHGPAFLPPGPLRVDTTGGPGHGWIYQTFSGRPTVITADSRNYADPTAWKRHDIARDAAQIFSWLDLDSYGNAYVAWVDLDGAIYYSFSKIDDPANDPRKGGVPGTRWSPQIRVSLPSIGSAIFPTLTAGDPGRIAVAYNGTEDFQGEASKAGADVTWRTYSAVITDALQQSGPPIVHTGLVSHRPVHTGNIDGADKSLLDFISADHDDAGRVGVTFTDNHSRFGSRSDEDGIKIRPFTHFAKQVAGPSLLADTSPVDVATRLNATPDAAGDATWPNAATGANLPGVDVVGASLFVEGDELVARIRLADATPEGRKRALDTYNSVGVSTPAAERLQYVLRFSSGREIYHLSADQVSGEGLRFYGGMLDDNDDIRNETGNNTVVGAAYRPDPIGVRGHLDGDTIVVRGPMSAFGVRPGTELFSVTAFGLVGPSRSDESLLNPPRVVDATPPFNVVLTDRPLPLDCTPETGLDVQGTVHEIVCKARDGLGQPLGGVPIHAEVAGVADPDGGDTPETPDLSCVTADDGTCTIAAEGPTAQIEGANSYRFWLAPTGTLIADMDLSEGRDEVISPGSIAEPDTTDVVEATWSARLPANVDLSFEEARGDKGQDLVLEANVVDVDGDPIPGASVEWAASGVGGIITADSLTDESGTARATARSGGWGQQAIAVSAAVCADGGRCTDDAIIHWVPTRCDVFGTAANDTLRGTGSGEVVCGLGGDDTLLGGGGTDLLLGGSGSDTLRGGAARDVLFGRAGADLLMGGAAKDRLRGGRGDDRLDGGLRQDGLWGGPGIDTCTADRERRSCERR